MNKDVGLGDALYKDLADLAALHGPPGFERPIIERLRDLFAPLVDDVAIDHMGNLTATLSGPYDAPHVVVSAHADEVGAAVASIEYDGFLRLEQRGGVQPRLLEGRAVSVNGHPGVIGARSWHLTPRAQRSQSVGMDDLYVDLGVDDAAAVHTLGVRIGHPVVVLSELRRLAEDRIAGKGIDNRAGCTILLHLLRRLQGHALPCRLTALVTVQEEVGFYGAITAFERLKPNLAIVIDTLPAGSTPDLRALGHAPLIGQGVVIADVDCATPLGLPAPVTARRSLVEAAERASAPYQQIYGIAMPTDAIAALQAGRCPTLQVGIPRRYSHSPVETLDLQDLAATLDLVEELVLHPPTMVGLSLVE